MIATRTPTITGRRRVVVARTALAGLLAAFLATPTLAQRPVSDEIDVHVAEVEVRALDRDGAPVTGLSHGDFELRLDGAPVMIESFEAVAPVAAPREDEAAALVRSEPARALWLAFYFDLRTLAAGDLDPLRQDLRAFLGQLPRGTSVMVAAGGEGFEILEPFSRDLERLTRRLETVDGDAGGGELDARYRRLLGELQSERLDDGASFTDQMGPAAARTPRGDSRALLAQIDAFDDDIQRRTGELARDLEMLVRALGALPGRAQLVYLGRRLPTGAPGRLREAWRATFEKRGNRAGELASDASPLDDETLDVAGARRSGRDAGDLVEEMAERAAAVGVVVHAVSAGGAGQRPGAERGDPSRGLGAAADAELGRSVSDRSLADLDGLRVLAEDTGGRYLGRGVAADFFSGALADLGAFYRLGFTAEPGEHRLEVKLRGGGGAELRHPRLLRLQSRDQELAERTQAALTLESDLANPLGLRLELAAPRRQGQGWTVPVKLRVPVEGLALFADRTAHAGNLSIYAAGAGPDGARAEDGSAPAVTKAAVPVRLRNTDLLTALGREIEVEIEVALPAPGGRVAVTVRDDVRPRSATVVAELGGDP